MTKTLNERQTEVLEKIRAMKNGAKVEELLQAISARSSVNDLVLMVTLGRELWDEYQGILRETVDKNANDFFTRLAAADANPQSIF